MCKERTKPLQTITAKSVRITTYFFINICTWLKPYVLKYNKGDTISTNYSIF